jgi:DtxR family Mn-dependent transcriptional regulator
VSGMAIQHKPYATKKALTSVTEDYLEAIYNLNREKRVVHVKDIATRLAVKMPTVSSMLKTLHGNGLVKYKKYECVELTKIGADVGQQVRRRHRTLLKFLTEILKIEFIVADEEACKMEHALSIATLDNLADFMAFVQACPTLGESWCNYFKDCREHDRDLAFSYDIRKEQFDGSETKRDCQRTQY